MYQIIKFDFGMFTAFSNIFFFLQQLNVAHIVPTMHMCTWLSQEKTICLAMIKSKYL